MVFPRVGRRPGGGTANDLPLLEAILARLGTEAFTSPRLVGLKAVLAGGSAAARVRGLMRPGVVPHGNGVALMRAVGLEV